MYERIFLNYILSLFIKDKSLKVKYNSIPVPIRNFQQYIDLYIGDRVESPRVYDESGERNRNIPDKYFKILDCFGFSLL